MWAASCKLRIKKLSKRYGRVTALAGATLEVREGEFLTLLGPSGSGKTTLLLLLAGIVQPDGGEIWINGQPATYQPTHRRDIGMVFQNYALFPHLSVFENIAFPLRMRRRPAAEIAERVSAILDAVRLPHVANRLPRELSGGQQQRIALARCTVYQPSIILMDEPLGALDKKLRDQMQIEIKQLHIKLGITVLYVTHDQEEAMVMSDRICLMDGGEIVQLGTPDDLYFRPSNVFAASFLGESNIFKAVVVETAEAETVLRLDAGMIVRAAGADGVRNGEIVDIMVRPESLRVLAEGEQMPNSFETVLEDIAISGGITRYYTVLPDGRKVVAASLTDGPRGPFEPGRPMRLGWRPDRTVLLRPSPAAS